MACDREAPLRQRCRRLRPWTDIGGMAPIAVVSLTLSSGTRSCWKRGSSVRSPGLVSAAHGCAGGDVSGVGWWWATCCGRLAVPGRHHLLGPAGGSGRPEPVEHGVWLDAAACAPRRRRLQHIPRHAWSTSSAAAPITRDQGLGALRQPRTVPCHTCNASTSLPASTSLGCPEREIAAPATRDTRAGPLPLSAQNSERPSPPVSAMTGRNLAGRPSRRSGPAAAATAGAVSASQVRNRSAASR
ncbi:hypothetical protein OV450_8397 [Actinobacteria bacterium OV450]|nr:hypothetical protein OV450_8397 [Actinobacteria bacterium OV450]